MSSSSLYNGYPGTFKIAQKSSTLPRSSSGGGVNDGELLSSSLQPTSSFAHFPIQVPKRAQTPPAYPVHELYADKALLEHLNPVDLTCPICNFEVADLEELNIHLDREHPVDEGGFRNWFRDKFFTATTSNPNTTTSLSNITKQPIKPPIKPQESLASRTNSPVPSIKDLDVCVICKTSGSLSEFIGCNKCKRFYCESHGSFDMRLSPQGKHDPENGEWQKVCKGCFTSRDGYLDYLNNASYKDWKEVFFNVRKKTIDKADLEKSRLLKRLDKVSFTLQRLKEKTAN